MFLAFEFIIWGATIVAMDNVLLHEFDFKTEDFSGDKVIFRHNSCFSKKSRAEFSKFKPANKI